MSKQYFGTDGIRGTVGRSPITPDFILHLGHTVGRLLKAGNAAATVLIGKDTRISGYMLESALESGFNSAGVDVVLLGPIPTPAVAYLTRAVRADLGVVISASHNPFEDNGIKFFSAQGSKLPDEWEEEVERGLALPPQWAPSAALGKARRMTDAAGRYIEFCKSTFPTELSLKGLKLVVDAAHGAAYQCAPKVFHELGAEVIAMGAEPDGFNINLDVGATAPQALIERVRASGADYGIALDGDADRLQLVDATGRLFNGDELLYLMARARLEAGEPVQGVVGTLMTNLAIEQAFARLGIPMQRAKVGDRYVIEALQRNGWVLGGESSGHLLALDRHTTGDGIISALQVLQQVVRGGHSVAQALQGVQLFPQTMINVRLADRDSWQQHAAFQNAMREAEAALQGQGRLLVRPSGTEPVLRLMVEAQDPALAQHWAERLASVLQD
ncbi:phosphoglucosamine mutase [Vandammella animalimorsus]|uniref:Phosphoglucosamine mutase n=1 Tax=Vandammella animalimorsus TaxID=2029117 RepID=A0A2A2T8I6_9BURK|nr:phosphoglucosamine mutase [Vandammella animalimorsus]PAX18377.1 phosphoglucosamine mutase [Vandammella animalimorsus]PAX20541.1 phosphoglucosamine mutase [Vandammella animalimorsus]